MSPHGCGGVQRVFNEREIAWSMCSASLAAIAIRRICAVGYPSQHRTALADEMMVNACRLG